MKFFLITIAGICIFSSAYSQHDTIPAKKQLPFHIDESKRMPDFELEDKKEGTFFTGLPRIEYDPVRGWGGGGTISMFINKTRNDPFFEYTPYRHRVNAEFHVFQNGRVRYNINYDSPYLFNSRWRVRIDLVGGEDPNTQYFGVGRSTLQPLTFRDKRTGETRAFRKIRDYDKNLAIAEMGIDGNYYTDFHFNHIFQREQLYNILGERIMMGGRLRMMFGYEALFTSFSTYQGKPADEAYTIHGIEVPAINNPTLIDLQIADGTWQKYNLTGFTNSENFLFTSMLAGALIYDTRDYEPDPSKGVFLQYSNEYTASWLGSDFIFNKLMVQGQFIETLTRWRNNKSRLTFAGLLAFGYISGPKINFIEMWDLSSQAEAGGVAVLGGGRSLRGYRESRFLAPFVSLVNIEMRVRFYEFSFLRQHFSLGFSPFYDMGSVWDRPGDFNLREWKGAPGLGFRFAWNQSTIRRLDIARSREGLQSFFGLGHIF